MDMKAWELYSAAQVREFEQQAIASGIAGHVLMQRAAAAVFAELDRRWPQARRYAVICGAGNNGGDGYEVARLLLAAGRSVDVWQVGPPAADGDAELARAAWIADGGTTRDWAIDAPAFSDRVTGAVIIDALFGIGLSRAVQEPYRGAIQAINAAHVLGSKVLAVDVPSGLDANSGRALGVAVRADVTVTFIAVKSGLYLGDAADYSGAVVLENLQLPGRLPEGMIRVLAERDLRRWLPPRKRSAHKGDNGHVLLIGGDHGMSGAILIAARAALRAGAGLVTVATRAAHAPLLTAAQPEVMFHGVETDAELRALLARADVVAVGPGLGQGPWGWIGSGLAWTAQVPVVVDADALNLLVKRPLRRDDWVLTPHPGEAARMLGIETAAVQADRVAAVKALRARYGGVAVLKGAGSLVCGELLQLCPFGNPGMGVGGMGDALTGIIAACIAQGLKPEDAAAAGVTAHARAGDYAAQDGERGLLPSDLIDALRAVLN